MVIVVLGGVTMGERDSGTSNLENELRRDGYVLMTPNLMFPIEKTVHAIVVGKKIYFTSKPVEKPSYSSFSFDITNDKENLSSKQTSNSPFELKELTSPTSSDKYIVLMQNEKRAATILANAKTGMISLEQPLL